MLKTQNIDMKYIIDHNEFFAIKDVSIEIPLHKLTMIVGKSGSGKTTLLHLLSGLEKPSAGQVFYGDKDLWELTDKQRDHLRSHVFGYIFQNHFLEPNYTVYQNLFLSFLPMEINHKDIKIKIINMLEKFDLSSKINVKAKKLSGGESQRIALIRALLHEPDIIFADEPTGNLDSYHADYLIDELIGLKNQGKTIILVTHDLTRLKHADYIIRLEDGKVL